MRLKPIRATTPTNVPRARLALCVPAGASAQTSARAAAAAQRHARAGQNVENTTIPNVAICKKIPTLYTRPKLEFDINGHKYAYLPSLVACHIRLHIMQTYRYTQPTSIDGRKPFYR